MSRPPGRGGEGDPRTPSRLGPRPGVDTYGACPVISRELHDQWCSGWNRTRDAARHDLAHCPGCNTMVRIEPTKITVKSEKPPRSGR